MVISASRLTLQGKDCDQKTPENLTKEVQVFQWQSRFLAFRLCLLPPKWLFTPRYFGWSLKVAISSERGKNAWPSVSPAWEMDQLCTSVPEVLPKSWEDFHHNWHQHH
jgi:hypothetical protein